MAAQNSAEKDKTCQSVPLERQTYTIEEAARILGICRAVAYRKGVLPTVQIAGRRLVPKQALERILAGEPLPSITANRIADRSREQHESVCKRLLNAPGHIDQRPVAPITLSGQQRRETRSARRATER